MVDRIILDQSKKKIGFDNLNYLVSPEEFVTDYKGLNIPLYNKDKSKNIYKSFQAMAKIIIYIILLF